MGAPDNIMKIVLVTENGLEICTIEGAGFFWRFMVNGEVAVWSKRYFPSQVACIVDASNNALVI